MLENNPPERCELGVLCGQFLGLGKPILQAEQRESNMSIS